MSSSRLVGAVLVFMVLTPLVKADIISSLGDTTPGFVSGSTHTSVAYQIAMTGSPAPFNAFCGNLLSMDCSASWKFTYTFPTGQTISGATLTLGIADLDSAAPATTGGPVPGNKVASYTVGSTNLTAELNTADKALDGGTGSVRNEFDILTVTIPSSGFGTLASGTAPVSLTLQGEGLGVLGFTPFYAVGLVYSTLDIQTSGTTAPVPEPASLALLLPALGAFGLSWARRKQNRERVGQMLSSVKLAGGSACPTGPSRSSER